MIETVTIYGLVDPRTDVIRYVGMTTRSVDVRLREHLKDARGRSRRRVAKWLRCLHREGLQAQPVVLELTTRERWRERERYWIAKYRSEDIDLVNTTDGGEGVLGHRHDEAARAKIRARRAQQQFSDETRQLWSEQRRGNQHALGNKVARTPEHQSKLVEARRRNGTYDPTPDARARMSAAATGNQNRLGTVQSPEAKAKISAAKKGQTPWIAGRKHTAETRAKMQAAWVRRRQGVSP